MNNLYRSTTSGSSLREGIEADGMAAPSHPDDVLGHPGLSEAEKRAMLALWASDAHAVKDAPTLRQVPSGAVVALDDILRALRHLDGSGRAAVLGPTRIWRLPLRRRAEPGAWRPRGTGFRRPFRDDDDDPPPCPAAARPPRLALAAGA